LSLITGDDGAPLSKRNGARSLRELREAGYLPEAIFNLLFRLGHSSAVLGMHDLATLAQRFDTAHLGRAPARFDFAQLEVFQKDAVHALTPSVPRSGCRRIYRAVWHPKLCARSSLRSNRT
jgi:glutamyl-tRNA synthetase